MDYLSRGTQAQPDPLALIILLSLNVSINTIHMEVAHLHTSIQARAFKVAPPDALIPPYNYINVA